MTKKGSFLHDVIRVGGIVLVLFSLSFITFKLWKNWGEIVRFPLSGDLLVALFGGAFLYALSCCFLSFAWWQLLVLCGQADASYQQCHFIYARTQIAKYIPGNVWHFAGRHLLGNSAGFHHLPLAGAALYEIIGLLFASSAIAGIGILCLGVKQELTLTVTLVAVIILALLSPWLLRKVLAKLTSLQGGLFVEKRKPREILKGLILPYGLYFLFSLMSGGILWGLVAVMTEKQTLSQSGLLLVTAALSWIAGLLTPGAPAGIGARETIIVVSLESILGEPKSLFAAGLFRTITILGDVLFFCSSYFFQRQIVTQFWKKSH